MSLSWIFLLLIVPTQQIELPGLKAQVVVVRDSRGVAHIEASSEEDLYYVQGYITAADRLWQMDLLRRAAAGRLSELFGDRTLKEDERRRTLGYSRAVEQAVKRLDGWVLRVLERYSQGVNAYIASLSDEALPLEFKLLGYRPEPWKPQDCLLVGKNLAEALASSWQYDLLRTAFSDLPASRFQLLFPESSDFDVLIVGYDTKESKRRPTLPAVTVPTSDLALVYGAEQNFGYFEASNNWVVSGKRTVTGKPILANDPHLRPTVPSVWHMIHLKAGRINVAGVTFPGVPGVIIGHNDYIAWGCTNLTADQQDLYSEQFDSTGKRYKTPFGWKDAEVFVEQIRVRESMISTATKPVTLEVVKTRHGPVVLRADNRAYALRWHALDAEESAMEAFLLLNRARNWREFRAALARYDGAAQNFVYADLAGNIGYQAAGKIPIRSDGDGSFVVDGSSGKGEWTGWVAFDDLPRLYNPPSGIIVTANSRVVGDSYRRVLTRAWADPFRSRRIFQLLQQKGRLSVEDMTLIQCDTRSFFAEILLPRLRQIARESGNLLDDFIKDLEGWDGMVEPNESAPLILEETLSRLEKKLLVHLVGPERADKYVWPMSGTFLWQVLSSGKQEYLPAGYPNYGSLIADCYKQARQELGSRLEYPWLWGKQYVTRFKHPLAEVPGTGQLFEIKNAPMRGSYGHLVTVNVGDYVSMRFVADLSNWDRSVHGIALGVVGTASSPHWTDQFDDWLMCKTRSMPWTAAAIEADKKSRTIFRPQISNMTSANQP
ncbi:MAG: penicillin acylase family protein [Acidobacteriota bacterium]|nr:penicillin acylase family protein [Blastocatellia bacterium]MDW8412032.1 penicillin acylase family protein [Acidobacteriota bacterium]